MLQYLVLTELCGLIYPCNSFLCLLQIKRRLPKVNRGIFKNLLENEEAETKKDADDADIKKKSKKRKGLNAEVLKDGRFDPLFKNTVLHPSVNNI